MMVLACNNAQLYIVTKKKFQFASELWQLAEGTLAQVWAEYYVGSDLYGE